MVPFSSVVNFPSYAAPSFVNVTSALATGSLIPVALVYVTTKVTSTSIGFKVIVYLSVSPFTVKLSSNDSYPSKSTVTL